ncbi:hypothetical protein GQ53DRAFT_49793 [Thozetella sp. PMI_491]|nr:hypothetical protein GQ53DRAFT_49793 [Thozetella sp. PMI_491]
MRSIVLPALLGFATLAASSPGHRHQHARLRPRKLVTVIDTVTQFETVYVNEDGSPLSTTSSSTSTKEAAVFIQVATTTSTSTTSSSTSTTPPPETPTPTPTTLVQVPSPEPTTPAPAPVSSTPAAVVNPNERTFTVVNSHTAAVFTKHDDTVGTPTSAGQPLQPGTMAAGATATFAVPTGWVGNIAYTDASNELNTAASLFEGNFAEWWGVARADFDVSYVNGFTLPGTCSCAGQTTTGCNLDLLSLFSCPEALIGGACPNSLRADTAATAANSFFSACAGAAWTFVEDGGADSNCPTGDIVWCIGAACPANPKQSRR